MSRQVLVIGNHRTGSSCVAGILYKAGISMGRDMLEAHPSNPVGHFEDKAFLLLNESLVAPWDKPVVLVGVELAVPRIRYQRLITERDSLDCIWGIKDPRMCITAQYFMDLMYDPVIINIRRNSDSVIRSLMRRDGWTKEEAIQIHHTYSNEEGLTLKCAVELEIPIFQIYFEDLLESPWERIQQLINFASDNGTFPLHPHYDSGLMKDTLVSFVNPDLVNFHDGGSDRQ